MTSPSRQASLPDSVSPDTLNTDQDDAFNLDAWAAASKDPTVGITPELARSMGLQPEIDLPNRDSQDPETGERPAWAAMKTKAGKDRKRLPLACIACRRKKIKCSGEKPTCQHCVKARIPCVYKITQRKATPRTDYMAMLDKRLKRMEDRVIRIAPKEKVDSIPRAVVKPSAQPLHGDHGADKKRPAGRAFADADLDLDGWAADNRPRSPSQLPKTAFFNKLDQGTAFEGVEALPSREIQEHLAEVYFDYIYGQSYFLLHKARYMLNLKAGNIPPYLNLAVCAVSARFSIHPQLQTEPAFLRGEDWAKAAQGVAIRYFDTPNIITVIVFVLLSLHGFGACQGGRAFMLSGMAHRMSYSLRLHRDPDHDGLGGDQGMPLDFVDREMRRRTMWACFQMDRFTASGYEKPLFAREGYLSILPLPVNEIIYMMEVAAPTHTLEGSLPPHHVPDPNGLRNDPKLNMGVAAHVVRVIALWGQMLEDMSLGSRHLEETTASWPSRASFKTFSTKLQEFIASLPRPYLYIADSLQLHESAGTANAFLLLHLVYNHCVLFLNRFAFPVLAGKPSGKNGSIQVLETARQTALDSANTISDIVSKSMEHRLTFPFGGYVAYVSSAVHLYGAFSKEPERQRTAKHNLTLNIKYLSRMKKHWGMYHILTENLKDLYRQYAEAARQGTPMPVEIAGKRGVYQYADWHERYPQGVSMADYEEVLALKPSGKEAAINDKSDLQSVENYFANQPIPQMSDPRQPSGPQKKRARGSTHRHQTYQANGPESQQQTPLNLGRQTQPGEEQHWPQLDSTANARVATSRTHPVQPPTMSNPATNNTSNADFSDIGSMTLDDSRLWGADWGNIGEDLLYSAGPFSDWNAVLNLDMMQGANPDTAAAAANSADFGTDVTWFGDLMQAPDPGMTSMADTNNQRGARNG